VEHESASVLVSVAPAHGQQVRPVGNCGGEKHNDLRVGRADDRHQVVFTPDLWRLRAKRHPFNGQRLVDAIGSSAQDDELVHGRRGHLVLFLGVREFRPQYHEQKRQHQYASR
jgi:hypothetical protein